MSDRPEPMAWWCYACENPNKRGNCCGPSAPLFPPSVVAGEWRWYEKELREIAAQGKMVTPATNILNKIADEAARRAKVWEGK